MRKLSAEPPPATPCRLTPSRQSPCWTRTFTAKQQGGARRAKPMHTANGQAAALIGGIRWIAPWLSVLLVSAGLAYAADAAVLRCCSSDTRVHSGSGSTLMTELSPAETRVYGVFASHRTADQLTAPR